MDADAAAFDEHGTGSTGPHRIGILMLSWCTGLIDAIYVLALGNHAWRLHTAQTISGITARKPHKNGLGLVVHVVCNQKGIDSLFAAGMTQRSIPRDTSDGLYLPHFDHIEVSG